MKLKNFFIDTARGAAIGIAMIIPGVSGGTLAVLLNVYDKLIDAISNIRRDFKNSVKLLLPIFLGALIAVAAAYFPLKYALKYAPFPTVMVFAGLIIGSCPKIIKDGIKKGFTKFNALSVVLPFALVIGICFIPGVGSADLSVSMPVWGYFVLLLVGAVASCALVVPGISGSMLLLIFGYYDAIFDCISGLKVDFLHSALVLLLLVIGIVVGFFTIAKLMKLLLTKFPRGTGWAIIGFVLGSVPAIFITYNSNFPEHIFTSLSTAHVVVGCVLGVLALIASYALTEFICGKAEKKIKDTENL